MVLDSLFQVIEIQVLLTKEKGNEKNSLPFVIKTN
jgi:hypothetical protein